MFQELERIQSEYLLMGYGPDDARDLALREYGFKLRLRSGAAAAGAPRRRSRGGRQSLPERRNSEFMAGICAQALMRLSGSLRRKALMGWAQSPDGPGAGEGRRLCAAADGGGPGLEREISKSGDLAGGLLSYLSGKGLA